VPDLVPVVSEEGGPERPHRAGSTGPHLSVVVPTFNRAGALATTVRSILDSELDEGVRVEVIVVDDGSVEPAADALVDLRPPPGWTLRVVRQENRGVGGARNRGYHEATAGIVLFVDDDMLLFPDTLQGHLRAHTARPGAVVFGRSPYVPQDAADPFVRWVLGLGGDPSASAEQDLVPVPVIASGHLSVERVGPLAGWPAVYADDMRTPVAEEYELSRRLRASGISAYVATRVVAFHNRQIDVEAFLRQQLGHGRGCGEVARLHPECLELDELREIIRHHRDPSPRRVLWVLLGSKGARELLGRAARAGQRGRLGPLAPVVFRLAAGAWFSAGVRSG
jgi:glycosyltransferase involved in cell wall biosynthesis